MTVHTSKAALKLAQRSGLQWTGHHAVMIDTVGMPSEPMGHVARCSCGLSAASRSGIVDAQRQLARLHDRQEAL